MPSDPVSTLCKVCPNAASNISNESTGRFASMRNGKNRSQIKFLGPGCVQHLNVDEQVLIFNVAEIERFFVLFLLTTDDTQWITLGLCASLEPWTVWLCDCVTEATPSQWKILCANKHTNCPNTVGGRMCVSVWPNRSFFSVCSLLPADLCSSLRPMRAKRRNSFGGFSNSWLEMWVNPERSPACVLMFFSLNQA